MRLVQHLRHAKPFTAPFVVRFMYRLMIQGTGRLLFTALLVTLVGYTCDRGLPAAQAQTEIASAHSGTEQLILGVVRGPDNQAQWSNITSRIQAAGITFQAIELSQIRSVADLSGVNVLFIPSVEAISAEQVTVLEAWVNRGGRIIASGPVGNLAETQVRQQLRSLLGAYWAFPLAQPANLQIVSNPSYHWVQDGNTSEEVWGGVLLPTHSMSNVVVTWRSAAANIQQSEMELFSNEQAAAVISNERATLLGWRWGMGSSQSGQFDSQWLQAALSYYQNTPRVAAPADSNSAASNQSASSNRPSNQATPTPRSSTRPQAPVAPEPEPEPETLSESSPPTEQSSRRPSTNLPSSYRLTPLVEPDPATSTASGAASSPSASGSNRVGLAARDAATPASPSVNSAASASPSSRFWIRPTERLPSLREPNDPAEQMVPPGLNVMPSALPINTYDALTMRQELESLIGRYESALFAARSQSSDTSLQASAEPILTASSEGAGLDQPAIALSPALQQAESLLNDWNGLIERREYEEVRSRWLAVRDALWSDFPVDNRFAQPEIRAMWLDRGTIVAAGSPQGLERVFDRLAAAGINTVFFETVNAGYPIYPSRVAPQQNPLTRHWDPLESAVELAHERGMAIHAWMWMFAAGNQAHNRILNQPDTYPGPLISANPDWANYDNRGQMIPLGQNKPFLDPANPGVRSYLLRMIGEVADRYDVDGIQLDYIRYPFQDPSAGRTYGYGLAARQQFQQRMGVDPLQLSPRDNPEHSPAVRQQQRRLWQAWTDFRTEQISSFVGEVSNLLERQHPDLTLSVAVFPHSEHERLQKLQQHWEAWAESDDVDLVVLMSYVQNTDQLERVTRPWLVENRFDSTLILPGIRLLDMPNEVALDQIQFLRDLPTGGYALFAVENLNPELQEIFDQTQGGDSVADEPIPYRQPFEAASARYQALLREWNWLLENRQMWVQGGASEQWVRSAQELDEALTKLAESPSVPHLNQARSRLNQFRQRLRGQVYVQSVSSRYRVRAWEHRLITLDNLLNYGEQNLLGVQTSMEVRTED